MENQNIQWETWGEQPQENSEQPQQQGWGEQTQQQENTPTWSDQPQEDQQQQNWSEQPQQEQLQPGGEQPQQENVPTWGNYQPQVDNTQIPTTWDGQPENENLDLNWGKQPKQEPLNQEEIYETKTPGDFLDTDAEEWETKTSILGLLPKLKIEALLYQFNYNNELATKEIIDSGFNNLDNDGKYKINYQHNTELANILGAIKNIGESRGMKLQHSYLYKNEPKESSINIARGECIYNYIYFLQGDYNSGNIVLDFSAINGPSEQVIQSTPGILLLLPGWVPYSITKNLSNTDMIAVAGRFTIKDY